jgi:hypothetical protein
MTEQYIPPVARVVEDDGGFERTVELENGVITTQTWVGDDEGGEWMQEYNECGDMIVLNSACTAEDEDW